MSMQKVIRTLVEYHVASNYRLWGHLLKHVTDAQFTQVLGYSHGCLHQQVVHLTATDRYWMHDIQTQPVTGLNPEDYPTRASFTPTFEATERALLAYAQSLTDAGLQEIPDGLLETRWEALVHIVNHGTDHRAQILSMLHSLGAPTLEQDFGDHLRTRRQVSKGQALQLIRFRRSEWERELASIPRDRLEEPVIGGWSIKDIVAHITWHDREMVSVLKKRSLAGSAWWDLPLEERNRLIFEQHRDQPLEEVLQKHDQVHRELMQEIEKLTDEDLNDPAHIKGMIPGMPLWQLLEQNTWIHYLEHTESLWTWHGI